MSGQCEEVGEVYFAVGEKLGLDWLRAQAEMIQPENNWERMAISAIVDDLFGQQRALTGNVLHGADGTVGEAAVERWIDNHRAPMARTRQLTADIRASGGLDVAKHAIANRHVRRLIID